MSGEGLCDILHVTENGGHYCPVVRGENGLRDGSESVDW